MRIYPLHLLVGSRLKVTKHVMSTIRGIVAMPGRTIWARARELNACIVTKDEDSILLQALDRAGPTIVWIRIGNAVRDVLLRRLPEVWPAVISAIERGEKIVEVG